MAKGGARPGSGKKKGTKMSPRALAYYRDKIRTAHIIHKLQQVIDAEVEMTAVQARVALGLLAKTLPDLHEVENKGEIAQVTYVAELPQVARTTEEWLQKHGPKAEQAKQKANGGNGLH